MSEQSDHPKIGLPLASAPTLRCARDERRAGRGAVSKDLYLDLDFENIPMKDYYDILLILKHSPSLANGDIVCISEEIISRMARGDRDIYSKISCAVIKIVYSMLQNIPDTEHLTNQIRTLYQTNSPVISPPSRPAPTKQPNIMKKMKNYSRDKNDSSN